jgi:hypothetical protein
VVCAFAAAQPGRVGVTGLLRGIVPGLDGFALFCFVLAVTLDRLPIWVSFTVATALNLALAITLITIGNRNAASSPSGMHQRIGTRSPHGPDRHAAP